MKLDDLKRALGRVSNKEPSKFGFLKQKALEAGMSTDEYIVSLAEMLGSETPSQPMSSVQSQQTQQNSSNQSSEIEALREEIRSMKAIPVNQPAQPQQAPFSAENIQGYVTAFGAVVSTIREMFPQQKVTDVMQELEALQKFQEKMGASEPDREDDEFKQYGMQFLSQVLGGGQAGTPMPANPAPQPAQVPVQSPQSGGAAPAESPDDVIEVQPFEPEEVKVIAAEVKKTYDAKALEMAKNMPRKTSAKFLSRRFDLSEEEAMAVLAELFGE